MSGRLKIIMEGDSKELEDIMRTVFSKRQAIEGELRLTDQRIQAQDEETQLLRRKLIVNEDQLRSVNTALRLTNERHTESLRRWIAEADEAATKAADVQMKVDKLETEIKDLVTSTELAAIKARLTIRNSLLALRSTVDALNFLSALTGEHVETHFLSMMSMGLSAALQIKMQAAVYAATPGMQPFALMILALLPTLTGMMLWQRAEMQKLQTRIHEQNEINWGTLLGGI